MSDWHGGLLQRPSLGPRADRADPYDGFSPLFVEQEQGLQAHFAERSARNADEVCTFVLTVYGQSYSPSSPAKLMCRLGFEYNKPLLLPAQADEAKQAALIARYEALTAWLGASCAKG